MKRNPARTNLAQCEREKERNSLKRKGRTRACPEPLSGASIRFMALHHKPFVSASVSFFVSDLLYWFIPPPMNLTSFSCCTGKF